MKSIRKISENFNLKVKRHNEHRIGSNLSISVEKERIAAFLIDHLGFFFFFVWIHCVDCNSDLPDNS